MASFAALVAVDPAEETFNTFFPRALLIIGKLPADRVQRRSFEYYRHNLRHIDVVTFDELLEKAVRLLTLMTDAS